MPGVRGLDGVERERSHGVDCSLFDLRGERTDGRIGNGHDEAPSAEASLRGRFALAAVHPVAATARLDLVAMTRLDLDSVAWTRPDAPW
jgi:hypothetical protein